MTVRLALLPGLGLLLAAVCAVGLSVGALHIPLGHLLTGSMSQTEWMVVSTLRAPRLVLGAMVGASLAVSGGLMQGLFRNPLASPSLIGVSTGASLGAAIGIVLFESWALALPGLAFVGAVTATVVVMQLGSVGGRSDTASLLLAGIAVNAVAGSGTGLLVYLADEAQLRTLTFFTLGSLGGASWQTVGWLGVVALVPVVAAPWMADPLNALLLGETEARTLGVRTDQLKRALVVVVCVGVAGCVAATGVIGFVGLAVPHLVRLLVGPDHGLVLPGSALLGAVLLVVADTLARTVVAPAELPIGILTTLLGGPFFMGLLLRHQGRS